MNPIKLNEMADNLCPNIPDPIDYEPHPTKCIRCGWKLKRNEENYCDSCVETMAKNDIENQSDELQTERVEEARKYNSIIK